MIANEDSQYEDIFTYWEAKDPEGMIELANEMSSFLQAFQRITDPLVKTLQLNYDIK